MHELSICQNLIKQVNQVAEKHHASLVKQIHLSIGPLSGIEPQLLKQAFPFASANTLAAHAELIVTPAPMQVECQQCGKTSDVDTQNLSCRHCGAWQTTLLSGDELMLTRIEMETSEEE